MQSELQYNERNMISSYPLESYIHFKEIDEIEILNV